MRNIRSWFGALIALVFATTMGAASAQNVKYFTLTEVTLTGDTVSAKFSNIDAGNSSFNAVSLKAITSGGTLTFVDPPVVTVTPPGTGSPPNPLVAESGTKLIVSDLSPVKKTKNIVVTAKVSSTVGSGGCMVIEWQGAAWTGSVSSPSTVFQQQNPNPTTVIGTGCKLSLVPPSGLLRTSTGTSASFAVTAFVTDSSNVPLPGVAVPFTLSGSAGCSFTTNPTGTTGTQLGGLSANLGTTAKTCTLTAATTSPALSDSKVVPVFDGELNCSSTEFNALNLPAPSTNLGKIPASGTADAAGYITGIRGVGDNKDANCTLLKYTLTNNISSASATTDPNGNSVPVGYYSFAFDPAIPNPVVAILSIYPPEWGDGTYGLPTRKTLICTEVPCLTAPPTLAVLLSTTTPYTGPWKIVPACDGTIVKYDSIPATAPGACLASEGWEVIADSSCTGTKPGSNSKCLLITSIAIIGTDPVFGR